jgi:GH15 family glucan-1,4-alpha-glucosidase
MATESEPGRSVARDAPHRVPPLDHAAIGNGRVLALVSPTSAIEWLCLPRFDSPSVFGRLLDRERGGTCRILAGHDEIRGDLTYVRNTNVARIRFQRGEHAWEVLDYAPRIPHGLDVRVPTAIVRVIRPLKGRPRVRIDLDPRPNYGRVTPTIEETAAGCEIRGGDAPLHVTSDIPKRCLLGHDELVLETPVFLALGWEATDGPHSYAEAERELDLTVAGWRAWAKTCALPTFAARDVLRSALCLKLHVHHDSGAVIAAATTSIPEAMATERTWDYRYCWLRDAAFVVEALRRMSHLSEGEKFIRYLRNVVEDGPIQPVYGIGGERFLHEEKLDHLAGFGGNGHVRVGNAAYLQRQNDLMGALVLSLDSLLGDPRIVEDDPAAQMPLIERLVEHAIRVADQPDTGIWEFRSMLRPYTFSRAMCWAAIHRGARMAQRLGHDDHAQHWSGVARREREIVLARGYNATLGYFTQALDGTFPDASNLLLPTIGLIDARDPRFTSTIEKYEKRLVDRGYMLRYRNPDDFGETTSAFTMCSFWWAEALALAGRLDDAIAVVERLVASANPVGLFSEDIDPATGGLLGNFPQAYTHVGLIHAATTIGELLEARDGCVRAWV